MDKDGFLAVLAKEGFSELATVEREASGAIFHLEAGEPHT